MDEFGRIQSLSQLIGAASSRVRVGIGDDAALVEAPSGELLLCTDAMVEGVHFDRTFAAPSDLGHKALAAVMSDLAAMNGRPLHALFSLALPASFSEADLAEFYRAASALAKELGVDIVGGDLTSSKRDLFIDAVAVGETRNPRTRKGAREGDLLAVSGCPGASAAGRWALENLPATQVAVELRCAHLRPMPRFDLLEQLAPVCTALIDISDGVSSELHHLAKSSEVGFVLDPALLPIHPQARELALAHDLNAIDWALSGGEDYELMATLSAELVAQHGLPRGFTIVGRAMPIECGVQQILSNGRRKPLPASGFNHFATSAN